MWPSNVYDRKDCAHCNEDTLDHCACAWQSCIWSSRRVEPSLVASRCCHERTRSWYDRAGRRTDWRDIWAKNTDSGPGHCPARASWTVVSRSSRTTTARSCRSRCRPRLYHCRSSPTQRTWTLFYFKLLMMWSELFKWFEMNVENVKSFYRKPSGEIYDDYRSKKNMIK